MPPKPKVEQYRQLKYYAAANTVLLVRMPYAVFKIARISFGKDGSIYVQFPYCTEKSGWIGELPIARGQDGPTTYALTEHGSFVSTDVKFSHHRSGIALFSKSGHDIPSTRRHSYPLNGPIGHLFNLQITDPHGFALLTKADPTVQYLALDFPDQSPATVTWRAEWRRKDSVVDNIQPRGGIAGPKTKVLHRQTGIEEEMVFLGQPEGYAMREHVMLLTGAASERPSGAQGAGMYFLAGWNAHEVQDSGQQADLGGALCLVHPARPPSSPEALSHANSGRFLGPVLLAGTALLLLMLLILLLVRTP